MQGIDLDECLKRLVEEPEKYSRKATDERYESKVSKSTRKSTRVGTVYSSAKTERDLFALKNPTEMRGIYDDNAFLENWVVNEAQYKLILDKLRRLKDAFSPFTDMAGDRIGSNLLALPTGAHT